MKAVKQLKLRQPEVPSHPLFLGVTVQEFRMRQLPVTKTYKKIKV